MVRKTDVKREASCERRNLRASWEVKRADSRERRNQAEVGEEVGKVSSGDSLCTGS